jgi:polysaccharide pyruvyl transferase WcaK-like protein
MTSTRPRPRYHLVGANGVPNYGDELIAATWLRHLAVVAPQADVVVDCLRPETARENLRGLHPRARFTSVLWQLCWRSRTQDAADAVAFVEAAVRRPGRVPRLAAQIEELTGSDVVHVLGGGYVNALWPEHLSLLAGAAAAAERGGAVAAMTGQGLHPVAVDAAPLLRRIAAGFAVADVRDEPSARLLGADGTTATVDDVFLGFVGREPEGGVGRFAGEAPEVMVCVQSDLADDDADRLARFVRETLRRWEASDAPVGFVECVPGAERAVFDRVARHLPHARWIPLRDILTHGLPARPGQVWLSSRFHPHLVAAAAGAGGAAVSVNAEYYPAKHRSLLAQGSGWSLSEGLRIPPRPSSGGFGAEVLARHRAAKTGVADLVYGAARGGTATGNEGAARRP